VFLAINPFSSLFMITVSLLYSPFARCSCDPDASYFVNKVTYKAEMFAVHFFGGI